MKIKYIQGHCCQHNLLHFLFGHRYSLLCSSSEVGHPTVQAMQKRSHIWLPTLSIPDVGKWQAFLPEWFAVGASMAPVFSVDPCWDTFPHFCIAVLCVSAQMIYGGTDWMKSCVISAYPFKGKWSFEQMRMCVCWVFCIFVVGTLKTPSIIYSGKSAFTSFALLLMACGFRLLQIHAPPQQTTTVTLSCCASSSLLLILPFHAFLIPFQ